MARKPIVLDLINSNEYQPLFSGTPETCGMRSGRVCLTKEEFCGEHSTNAHEEILVFLQGNGKAIIGNEEEVYEVGVGKVLYIPPHTDHNIQNVEDEPLVYIYCVAPVSE